MPRQSRNKARFSLETLETRNLLSGVELGASIHLNFLGPNPTVITAGIQLSPNPGSAAELSGSVRVR
jgi:hypothetical protein